MILTLNMYLRRYLRQQCLTGTFEHARLRNDSSESWSESWCSTLASDATLSRHIKWNNATVPKVPLKWRNIFLKYDKPFNQSSFNEYSNFWKALPMLNFFFFSTYFPPARFGVLSRSDTALMWQALLKKVGVPFVSPWLKSRALPTVSFIKIDLAHCERQTPFFCAP